MKLELAGFDDRLDMACERNGRVRVAPRFLGGDVLKDFDNGEEVRNGSLTSWARDQN